MGAIEIIVGDLCCAQTATKQRISNEQIMAAQKRPFTGLLRKAMHLGDEWFVPDRGAAIAKNDLFHCFGLTQPIDSSVDQGIESF